jgi:hypothetical protein
MKSIIVTGTIAFLALPLWAADPGAKDELQQAAKKLAGQSYGWRTSVENAGGGGGGGAGGGQFRAGPTDGVIDKDGTTVLSMSRGDTTTRAVLKGDKGAMETQDGWRSLAELADGGGQPGRGGFMARTLRTFKAPAAEAEELIAKAKEITKADGVYSTELTEQGAKELLARRGRGGQAPEPKNAKGSAKFWIKDGVLSKYQYHLTGTVTGGQENREVAVDRTTTVEIKDVGAAKIEVPGEAKGKLS